MKKTTEFDLVAAVNGKKVITRDGRQVIIAGYNATAVPCERVIGWIDGRLIAWHEDGNVHPDYAEDDYDLFMEVEYGYINLYTDELGPWVDERTYENYEIAEENGILGKGYVKTIEIEIK